MTACRSLAGIAFILDLMEPTARAGVVLAGFQEAIMWRDSTPRADALHATSEEEAAYVAGWTISGLATLGAILAVWIFAI
jgi:hypothetical protein